MGEPSVFDGMKEAEKLKYSECEIKRERQRRDRGCRCRKTISDYKL